MRRAEQGDVEALRTWLIGQTLPRGLALYVVGSLLEQDSSNDLDLAISFDPNQIALAALHDLMVAIRILGQDDLSIRIDCSAYPKPQSELMYLVEQGLPFTAYKLPTARLEQMAASEDSNVQWKGQLILINRRLDETNYYAKLPRKRVDGRLKRYLRPGRPLNDTQYKGTDLGRPPEPHHPE